MLGKITRIMLPLHSVSYFSWISVSFVVSIFIDQLETVYSVALRLVALRLVALRLVALRLVASCWVASCCVASCCVAS